MRMFIRRGAVLGCLLGVVVLAGCSLLPWSGTSVLPEPENLLTNSDASDGETGWTIISHEAFVEPVNGDPAFAVTHFETIRQSVDVTDAPGHYLVILASSASETTDPNLGLGQVIAACYDDEDPGAAQRHLRVLFEPDAPHEWDSQGDYCLLPVGTDRIEVTLTRTILIGTPEPPDESLPPVKPAPWGVPPTYNGEATWFDDIELWIVQNESDAAALIDDHKARHVAGDGL